MREELFGLYFKDQPIFQGLNENQIFRVYAAAKHHILGRNARIEITPHRSEKLYFLVKGKVKITSSTQKDSLPVKDILYPGEIFGNISLNGFHGKEYAEALVNNTIVYCFSVHEFRELIHLNHRLALNYGGYMSKKLNMLRERYEIWTRSDTKARFIYLLKKWSLAEGRVTDKYILLNNPLSLTDIADILSVSRQFMHRLIKEMGHKGVIKYSRKQIEVCKNLLQQFSSN